MSLVQQVIYDHIVEITTSLCLIARVCLSVCWYKNITSIEVQQNVKFRSTANIVDTEHRRLIQLLAKV